ncbi:hypothetical protein BJY04DRAFT_42228 [Aspergillus karnatakaensis]|uniref:uncharacterized protein n=1 Tax=Aspergillus karnatakaensis TaxID=1810916 RepID=UPI003CCDB76B
MATLLTLPPELLLSLPLYLNNIETFLSLSSTCRTLHTLLASTHPATLLHLAASSAPTFFSPHPYYLTAATARSVSSWSTQSTPSYPSTHRKADLRKALHGGIYRLYDFCIQHGGITLPQIREMYESRFTIINPLSDKIDKMAGKQWMKTPDFWNGGVSEAVTLFTEAERAALQIVIYGELFGGAMDAFLESPCLLSEASTASGDGDREAKRDELGFDMAARLDYLAYALPDTEEMGDPKAEKIQFVFYDDQMALRHVVRCGRWRRMWGDAIREVLDEGFEDVDLRSEHWKGKLLRDALMGQGLKGFEMVTRKEGVGLSRECAEKARWIWERIQRLGEKDEPEARTVGERGILKVSVVPDLGRELTVVYRQQWSSVVE